MKTEVFYTQLNVDSVLLSNYVVTQLLSQLRVWPLTWPSLSLWAGCWTLKNLIRLTCPTASPLENWRRPPGHPVLCGWRLPSRTWNQWTSPWMKQLTWLISAYLQGQDRGRGQRIVYYSHYFK